MKHKDTDLLIIGGGPAGLCAAISGASEGLGVVLLDNGQSLGGQARESNAIENYPGFPGGVTGDTLMGCFVKQARDFDSDFVAPTQAVKLYRDGSNLIAVTDDYTEYVSKSVIITIGLQYRRLNVYGIAPLMGRGVFYGAPNFIINDHTPKKISIIGGANSAGQAAVKLAQNPANEVTMVIRSTLDSLMSKYLSDRIKATSNINICEHCEVTEVSGDGKLEKVTFVTGNKEHVTEDMDCMCIFIGASPRTLWLEETLNLSSNKYILTGFDLLQDQMFCSANGIAKESPIDGSGTPIIPLPYETSLSGVFAAGDVRSGSTKRVAVAAGEGAGALQNVHKYLSGLE